MVQGLGIQGVLMLDQGRKTPKEGGLGKLSAIHIGNPSEKCFNVTIRSHTSRNIGSMLQGGPCTAGAEVLQGLGGFLLSLFSGKWPESCRCLLSICHVTCFCVFVLYSIWCT